MRLLKQALRKPAQKGCMGNWHTVFDPLTSFKLDGARHIRPTVCVVRIGKVVTQENLLL